MRHLIDLVDFFFAAVVVVVVVFVKDFKIYKNITSQNARNNAGICDLAVLNVILASKYISHMKIVNLHTNSSFF